MTAGVDNICCGFIGNYYSKIKYYSMAGYVSRVLRIIVYVFIVDLNDYG